MICLPVTYFLKTNKLKIIERYCNANVIFLNHGDEESINEIKEKLTITKADATIIVPDFCEVHVLT